MIADSVEFLARRRPPGAGRHGALLRRLQAQPRVRAAGARGRGRQRAPATSCCATPTAARCPHEVERDRRRRPPPRRRRRDHRHPLPRRHRLRGRQLDGRRRAPAPATCRARSTGSASAPATATSPRSSPTCSSSSAYRCLPEGRIERLTAVSHHVAEVLNRPLNPQAPYVGSSAFAHKAGLHVSAIVRAKDAYEHVDPELVGNGTRFVGQRDGRAGDDPDEGRRARPADGRPGGQPGDRRPQAARARGLPLRGGRRLARAADAPRRRLGAGVLPRREHAGDHRRAAGAATSPPRRRSRCGSAMQRHVHTAEGNGPVNAIDSALRAALGGAYPAARPRSTSPTTRCASSTAPRRPAPSPAC